MVHNNIISIYLLGISATEVLPDYCPSLLKESSPFQHLALKPRPGKRYDPEEMPLESSMSS